MNWELRTIKVKDLIEWSGNPRKISREDLDNLKQSFVEFGHARTLTVAPEGKKFVIIGGNQSLKALKELGFKEIQCSVADREMTEQEKQKLSVFLNHRSKGEGEWDYDILNTWDVDLADWGVDFPTWQEVETEKEQNKKLSDRFIIPPFSILDTKQGAWQQRKNYWLSLGIKSEEGREEGMTFNSDTIISIEGKDTSIFDPVLCELSYKWFNVPNGKILDCFAGGSVRGIVAAKLGYEYLGNDLRSEQIEANRINAKEVLQDSEIYPTWTCGDSLHIDTIAKGYEADLLFSCPPYADLEVYSDKKEDISNMPYKDFIAVYREIIRKSCSLLKDDRFAVFVVGDVRDKKGFYRNFVSDTIMAFWNCGVILYNEMILANNISSASLRAANYMINRKVAKIHQNVLVFYKGNPKNIKQNYPELDLSELEIIGGETIE